MKFYSGFIKRLFDFLAAFVGMLLLSPFMLILLPLVALSNGGPVFFTQFRPGYKGKIFRLVKFRTMNQKKDNTGKLLPDKERLTPVGKIIRSLSMDELPQLLNVLKGDMSIVGPRPLLVEYMKLYDAEQARRHDVRPGITGWAQVNGRNALSWENKFKYDLHYVDHISFGLDLKILYLSVLKVIKREGINSADAATAQRFTGTDKNNADE